MGVSVNNSETDSRLQNTYYSVRIIESLIIIGGAVFIALSLGDIIVVDNFLLLLILAIVIIISLVGFMTNQKERSIWEDIGSFLTTKRRSIAYFKDQAENARSPRYAQVQLRLYYQAIQYLLDDILEMKIKATSEGNEDLVNEFQNQIEELQAILNSRT